MSTETEQREHGAARLYINDFTDQRPDPGLYVYEAEEHHVVAVSFVAANGRAVRVNFDPKTGDVTTQDITEQKVAS